MNENEFSTLAQRKLGKRFDIQSFESSNNQSTPDLYLVDAGNGQSIWMEVKVQRDGCISFMPGQCAWLEKHTANKGLCYVLVLNGDYVQLYHGKTARWLSTAKAIPEGFHIKVASHGYAKSDWSEIINYIGTDSRLHYMSINRSRG